MLHLMAEANIENTTGNSRRVMYLLEGVGFQEEKVKNKREEMGGRRSSLRLRSLLTVFIML